MSLSVTLNLVMLKVVVLKCHLALCKVLFLENISKVVLYCVFVFSNEKVSLIILGKRFIKLHSFLCCLISVPSCTHSLLEYGLPTVFIQVTWSKFSTHLLFININVFNICFTDPLWTNFLCKISPRNLLNRHCWILPQNLFSLQRWYQTGPITSYVVRYILFLSWCSSMIKPSGLLWLKLILREWLKYFHTHQASKYVVTISFQILWVHQTWLFFHLFQG